MDLWTKDHSMAVATARNPFGTLHPGSNWRPISPKTQDLKIRYEAQHVMRIISTHSELNIIQSKY